MSVGDRLVVMNEGSIQQVGTPRDIYRKPTNAFVADFIGTANFFKGTAQPGQSVLRTASGLELECDNPWDGQQNVLVRPEAIQLSPKGAAHATGAVQNGRTEDLPHLGPTVEHRE